MSMTRVNDISWLVYCVYLGVKNVWITSVCFDHAIKIKMWNELIECAFMSISWYVQLV